MRIKAVLWDLDGVLVDTGEFHYLSWRDTLLIQGISYSREQFQQTFGMNNWGVLTTVLGHKPAQALYDQLATQKEVLFRELIHGQVKPLPGVEKTLQILKSKEIRLAIASSAPMENIDALVDGLGLRIYFDAIVSGAQMPGKPAPDVFLAAARSVNTPPENCLVIEDAVAGVAAAKNAGMTCLAVTNTNPAEKLHQADYIIDSLLEIKPGFLDAMLTPPSADKNQPA